MFDAQIKSIKIHCERMCHSVYVFFFRSKHYIENSYREYEGGTDVDEEMSGEVNIVSPVSV